MSKAGEAAAAAEGRTAPRRINLLTVTSLYPNQAMPTHGVFVENRLTQLVASSSVALRVVAPVPWFPFRTARFGAYARFARVPAEELRHGIPISHPRYPVLPKLGMSLAPFSLYAALASHVGRLMRDGHNFDLIDSHYFYPDGVAATLLGRRFGRPVVITARGSDLNLIADYALPRRMIRWAAEHAAGLITVSRALEQRLLALGVAADKIRVLRNGVDLELFHPPGRAAARARLGLDGPTLLSVGNLVANKGHDLVIRALASLPEHRLLIAGTGPEAAALDALSRRLGVAQRVRLVGAVPHAELGQYYGAADALVLATEREGWPNVLLEAMACGTPVIATAVGGVPEIVAAPEAGLMLEERSAAAIAVAVGRLAAARPERAATRAYAEGFGWEATTRGQLELFTEILGRPDPPV